MRRHSTLGTNSFLVITFFCHLAIVATPLITISGVPTVSGMRNALPLYEPLALLYFLSADAPNVFWRRVKIGNMIAVVLVITVWIGELATPRNFKGRPIGTISGPQSSIYLNG